MTAMATSPQPISSSRPSRSMGAPRVRVPYSRDFGRRARGCSPRAQYVPRCSAVGFVRDCVSSATFWLRDSSNPQPSLFSRPCTKMRKSLSAGGARLLDDASAVSALLAVPPGLGCCWALWPVQYPWRSAPSPVDNLRTAGPLRFPRPPRNARGVSEKSFWPGAFFLAMITVSE